MRPLTTLRSRLGSRANQPPVSNEVGLAYAQLYAFFKIVDESVNAAQAYATPSRVASFLDALRIGWYELSGDDRNSLKQAPELWELVSAGWETLSSSDRDHVREAWEVRLNSPIVIRS